MGPRRGRVCHGTPVDFLYVPSHAGSLLVSQWNAGLTMTWCVLQNVRLGGLWNVLWGHECDYTVALSVWGGYKWRLITVITTFVGEGSRKSRQNNEDSQCKVPECHENMTVCVCACFNVAAFWSPVREFAFNSLTFTDLSLSTGVLSLQEESERRRV